jgi:cytochrome c556
VHDLRWVKNAIKSAYSLPTLQQAVQQHSTAMDAACCAAAVAKLAHLPPATPQEVHLPGQLLTRLWQLLRPKQQQLTCTQLSNVVWACGKLQQHASEMYTSCVAAFMQHLTSSQANPQDASNVLYGLAKGDAVRAQPLLPQLLAVVLQQLPQASPQAVSNTLWAVATLGQHVQPEQLQQLVDAFTDMLQQAKPQEVANVMWAAASMRQSVLLKDMQQLLDGLAGMAQKAKPSDVANVLWAAASMGQRIEQQQLQHLMGAFSGMLPQAKPHEVSNVLWAAASMGHQLELQQLLHALLRQVHNAAAADISNALWAVSSMGQQLEPHQLQQLLCSLLQTLPQATSQDIANTLWAVVTMGQGVSAEQLQLMLARLVSVLPDASSQDVCNTLWACGKLGFIPKQLLSSPAVPSKLQGATSQQLATAGWACGQLGHRHEQVVGVLLQEAARKLAAEAAPTRTAAAAVAVERSSAEMRHSTFSADDMCNLSWCVAVLDLQQHANLAVHFAWLCSAQWGDVSVEGMQQLYQVHSWLLTFGLESEIGLRSSLSSEQLEHCRDAWHAALELAADAASASQLLQSVLHSLQQLPISWAEAPAIATGSVGKDGMPDGVLVVDIAARTAAGVLLAIEVDGPGHFRQPDGGLMGIMLWRNKALAVRGYRLVSIPLSTWEKLSGQVQQQQYLQGRLQPYM